MGWNEGLRCKHKNTYIHEGESVKVRATRFECEEHKYFWMDKEDIHILKDDVYRISENRVIGSKNRYLAKIIMNTPHVVVYMNNDPLDLRKSNLLVIRDEVRGATVSRWDGMWMVSWVLNGEYVYMYFRTRNDAYIYKEGMNILLS